VSPRWRRSTARTEQVVAGALVIGDLFQISNVRGDITIATEMPPPYRIEEYPLTLPVQRARAQLSRLLLPRYGVVPFAGRERELANLRDWMNSGETVEVRLIHGAGGQGKTRLAAKLAVEHAEHGVAAWRVVHTTTPARTAPSRVLLRDGGTALLILDYADRWPQSHLLALLTDLQNIVLHTAMRLRVLLLARSARYWWPALKSRLDSELGIEATGGALTPMGTQADRTALFVQARRQFASALQVSGTDNLAFPSNLDDEAFTQILALHMAALVAVDSHLRGRQPPASPHVLSEHLLAREQAYWYELHTRAEAPTAAGPARMRRAVYTATLTGALRHPDARVALQRVSLADSITEADQLVDDHQICYPPEDSATALEALHPDLLGEDFIALTTPGHRHEDEWQPDAWALTAAGALLGHAPTAWTPTTATVLVETARRWPHMTNDVLDPLLRERPMLFFQSGAATIARLADNPHLEPTALYALEKLLPDEPHIDLDVAAAAVATRLTPHRLKTATDPAERAELYATLSWRLANAGQREEALEPAEQEVTIYRHLAEAEPAAHLHHLARALYRLGVCRSMVGRHHDAVASAEEAAMIRWRLAEVDPRTYLFELAESLDSVGALRSAVGRWDQALAAAERAVAVYRALADADPAVHRSGLAKSLTNLGTRLSQVGRSQEAVIPAEEAVAIRRDQADTKPATYLPQLGGSLNNLGNHYAEVGRWEDAVACLREATGTFQELVKKNEKAYLPDLAISLSNLGARLLGAGRRNESLPIAEEAFDIYQRLARGNPAAYLAGFAQASANFSRCLAKAGLGSRALEVGELAVAIRRRLAQTNPAHLPELATSLNDLGALLTGMSKRRQALPPIEEAVSICRQLVQLDNAAQLHQLATSLINLSGLLSLTRRRPEAPELSTEAVGILRRLAEENPKYLSGLAASLAQVGAILAQDPRREAEGRSMVAEARNILRGIADAPPPPRSGPARHYVSELGQPTGARPDHLHANAADRPAPPT
jgi:tetratricopeptide (TPR) repeat protein